MCNADFLIVQVTPTMIASIGWATYLVFAMCNLMFIPIIFFFYPETKQRSLEEIDVIFAKAYVDQVSPVKAAHDMPPLTTAQIEEQALSLDTQASSMDGEKGLRLRALRSGSVEAKDEEMGTSKAE